MFSEILAPILYVAVTAALLWAAARWVCPISRGAGLLLVLLPLAITGPALLTGRTFGPLDLHFGGPPLTSLRTDYGLAADDKSQARYDVAYQMIPWRSAVRQAWARGEWPLLSPNVFSGDVLAGAAQPAPYHPLNLIAMILALGPSLTFVASVVLFQALLAAFLWNRELGCREMASLVGAVGFAFCGFVFGWLGWPHPLTAGVLPFLLLAVRRIARDEKNGFSLLLLAFVLTLLAGHPESAFHVIAVGAMYGMVELWVRFRKAENVIVPIQRAFGAGALALGLTAFSLLPFAEVLPQTQQYKLRQRIHEATPQSVNLAEAMERMKTVAFPAAYGWPYADEWLPELAKWGSHWQAYAGSVLWAPAFLALWAWRRRRIVKVLGAFAAGGILCYVAAPGLIDLLAALPLFDVTINRRLTFLAGLAISSLAALGLEYWARTPTQTLGNVYLGTLAGLSVLALLLVPGMVEDGLTMAYATRKTLYELVPIALVFLAFRFFLQRGARPQRLLAALLLLLVAQRVVQTSGQFPNYPSKLVAPPIEGFGVLPNGRDDPYRIVGIDRALQPNLATLYGLEDIRGTGATHHARYYDVFDLWSDKRLVHVPMVMSLQPFLAALNVRYAFLPHRLSGESKTWHLRWQERGFYIYENMHVLPRAFVPKRVRLGENREERLASMATKDDFSRVAWIEPKGSEPGRHQLLDNGPGRVQTRSRGSALLLDVKMRNEGWVVISQTAWKGWRAFQEVDGKRIEHPLGIANHAFLGLKLPAGEHKIELVYWPKSFVLGGAISLVSLLGLIIAVFLRSRKRGHELA